MRKLLSMLLALLLCGSLAFAQDNDCWTRNDISVGYGYFTAPQIICASVGILTGIIGGSLDPNIKLNTTDMKATGSFNLEYNYRFTKTVSLGIVGMFEKSDLIISGEEKSTGTKKTIDVDMKTASVLLNFRAFWFNKPHVSMYSKIAGGATFMLNPKADDKDTQETLDSKSVLPSFQLSPVCIDFGGTAVRGFVELGAGFQGIAVGGLRFRF